MLGCGPVSKIRARGVCGDGFRADQLGIQQLLLSTLFIFLKKTKTKSRPS
jgi:hypothetical protein